MTRLPAILTSLDFLREGAPWPPPTELERLKLYKQNRDLFVGKHDKVFKDWIRLLRDDMQASLEIILNWPKRLRQFSELQEMVIQDPRSGAFYYVHRTAGPQLAFYAERIQYLSKLFKKVGLVYSIDKNQRVGFWHIKTGRRYFASQNDFVEIRPSKR